MLSRPTLKIKHKRKIKNAKELPSWYSLKKYDSARKLTNEEWYEQLFIRQNCFYALQLINMEKGISKNFRETLLILRENPIVDISSNTHLMDLYSFIRDRASSEHNKKNPYAYLSVHPTTVHELYMTEYNLIRAKGNAARAHYIEGHQNFGNYDQLKHIHHEWFHTSIAELFRQNNPRNVLLTANFEQPDYMLIEQFKKMLPSIREISGIPNPSKKYKTLSPNELIKHSVLPFLDLHIWQIENQIKITDSVMHEAIYPVSKEGTGDLKTTKINALKALDLNRLEHFIQKQEQA